MSQQGEPRAKRGWLRGTFQVKLLHLVAGQFGFRCAEDAGVDVSVDFREPPPKEAIAEQAKALFDQGMLYKDIARQLNVSRALVIKAINIWFSSRGQPVPDGRLRRFELEQQTPNAYKFQQIADQALQLYDQGLLYKDIAQQLDCNYTTVTKAVHHAQIQRGLAPVDGRTRLKTISHRSAGSAATPAASKKADGIEPSSPAVPADPGAIISSHDAGDAPAENPRPAV